MNISKGRVSRYMFLDMEDAAMAQKLEKINEKKKPTQSDDQYVEDFLNCR